MSMGSGLIMEIPRKKKINGRSSTEAKIMGADNAFPQFPWPRYFIGGQGYAVEDPKYHQDNMSAMIMENNGKD